jgi:hypothetical protein
MIANQTQHLNDLLSSQRRNRTTIGPLHRKILPQQDAHLVGHVIQRGMANMSMNTQQIHMTVARKIKVLPQTFGRCCRNPRIRRRIVITFD